MRNSVRSTCNPSESDFEPPKYTAFLIAATDPFDREPKCSASSVALATTSSGGTTSSTAPLASASAGVNGLPSRMATKDLWVPMRRASRWVPPPPGMIPRSTSGWPMKKSPSAMTRRSHAQANSAPRPSGRTVEGSNEDDTAAIHPQKRRVQAVELDGSPQRGPAHHGLQDTGSVRASGHPNDGGGAASAERRDRGPPFLQPPDVSMADEPPGMRPCEDDGMDAWVAVDPVHQLLQLVGDVEAEQAVRAAVDPDDQDGSAVLDLEMALVFVCHGFSPPSPVAAAITKLQAVG